MTAPLPETIRTASARVACDGTGPGLPAALGHPRVFLHIDQDTGRITCPYCSRTYVLKLLADQ